jgi:glucose/arabinose dehydrogenase
MKMKFLSLLLSLFFIGVLNAQEVDIALFASGFDNPVDIQNAGDDRLFIVEQDGRIKILNSDGTTNPNNFLDITSIVSSGGERGLLGLAFHPDYSNNGYFYVNYTDNSGDTQISRFSVNAGDPDLADPGSELPLLNEFQPFTNHNGGCIQFGPDGYLYIGMGDGGSGGDPDDNAQNLLELLGKMLRIDVDNPGGGENYGIPADNPFVGNPDARDEIWASGVRNPWRFSFDSQTGDIWIADVGQNSLEEINHELSTSAGLNYGWRCYEANAPYNTTGCVDPSEMTFPVAQYSHSGGNCSITGGYVYRGTVYSDIQGLFLFADLCSGMIGTVDQNGDMIDHGNFSGTWTSFGEDVDGELYIADHGGSIYKIEGGVILETPDIDESHVSMIPNPASDSLHISVKNQTLQSISIMDLKGSEVFTISDMKVSEKMIPINSLSKGVYMVRIISGNGSSVVKKLLIR